MKALASLDCQKHKLIAIEFPVLTEKIFARLKPLWLTGGPTT